MNEQNQQLTKRERRELKKQQRDQQRASAIRKKYIKLFTGWGIGLAAALTLIVWGVTSARKAEQNKPGEFFASQGQTHIASGAAHPAYSSNPPTSGWHYASPARAGFYEEPIADETLIHNLEHGHVVISYDCTKDVRLSGFNFIAPAYADHPEEDSHEIEAAETMEANISPETGETLPDDFTSAECDDLKDKLRKIVEDDFNGWKVTAVPRVGNDSLIALTAWTRLQNLAVYDESAIKAFINAWRDKGPEKTPQ